MKVIAIISEYNPFHLGHLHQINEIKKMFENQNFAIITIMSGNFVQRGEPSIIDKFKRCDIALNNGVNLCLEIPVQFALSSAENFAFGAVNLLNKLNIVDYLCFGCETPNVKQLKYYAKIAQNLTKEHLEKFLKNGISFPKARELALLENSQYENHTNFLSLSNNILAIEYIKALDLLNSSIEILPIKREGNNYNDPSLSSSISSATSIRNFIKNQKNIEALESHLPNYTYSTLLNSIKNNELSFSEYMFKYIKYKLLTTKNIEKIEDVTEGLENKFYSEIEKSDSFEDLILDVKSKRYTYLRISRILTKYFIGFENFDKKYIKSLDNYVNILGFDKKGADILNIIKKNTTLTLISKFNKKNKHLAPLDMLSTKAYSIINKSISSSEDFKRPPIIKI